jgi:hypothetical protein
MHAILIEAGGIIPLPRVGGALLHAGDSIRNLPQHCQTGVCQASRFRKAVSSFTCGELGGEINLHCQLVFKPTATGTRTATLNVNDGANNSPQTIFLTGTGD